MISRALSWASSRALRSIDRASLTASRSASSRIASSSTPFASSADIPETCSRAATRSWLSRPSSPRWTSTSRSRSPILRLFSSRRSARWSSCSSRASSRRSRPWSSVRFARASSSASRCSFSFSSLASRIMSFCWVRASATIRAALSWAAFRVWFESAPRATNPTAAPTAPAASTATRATIGSIFGSSRPAEVMRRARQRDSGSGYAASVDAWARDRAGPLGDSARSHRLRRGSPGTRPWGPRPVDCVAYYGRPEPAGRRADRRHPPATRAVPSRRRRLATARSGRHPQVEASSEASLASTRRETLEHTSGANPLRASWP